MLNQYEKRLIRVDSGFGEREYWAYTNEYGQLVRVAAAEIILQNNATKTVNYEGRYYDDEAKSSGYRERKSRRRACHSRLLRGHGQCL